MAEPYIQKELKDFLCLKYQYSGLELRNQIEDDKWKPLFNDWARVRSMLTYKKRPTLEVINAPYEKAHDKITVILPKTDIDEKQNIEFLKGAAYYPFQLEPEPIQEFAYDEACLIQLAFATYYGYWTARTLLSRLDRIYPNMSTHKLCLRKDLPQINESEYYYEFSVPNEFQNKDGLLSQKEFINQANGPKNTLALFDYLLEIARTGVPPNKNYK